MAHLLSPDMARRDVIIAAARGWLGTPYRHQGARRDIGCDCLGLVLGVWRDVYGTAPGHPMTYSPDWAEISTGEPLLDACRAHCTEIAPASRRRGDLMAFRFSPHVSAKHLAILVDDDTIIHARQGHAVCEAPLTRWWLRRLAGVFVFPAQPPKD